MKSPGVSCCGPGSMNPAISATFAWHIRKSWQWSGSCSSDGCLVWQWASSSLDAARISSSVVSGCGFVADFCRYIDLPGPYSATPRANKEAGFWPAPGLNEKIGSLNPVATTAPGESLGRDSGEGGWYRTLLHHSRTYLSRLESGWEEAPCPPLLPLPPVPENPLPVPADWRFPERSFSTAARFPVRAASRSSCSFPISNPKESGEDAGKRRKQGRLTASVKFLSNPPFFYPHNRKLFLTIAARMERKQKLPPPMDPSIPIHGAAGGKVWSAARYQHRANFLWPVPRAPSVTSLKLPFSSAPTSLPRHPHPSCSTKKWMGINNMAPQHKNWQCLYPSRTGIT